MGIEMEQVEETFVEETIEHEEELEKLEETGVCEIFNKEDDEYLAMELKMIEEQVHEVPEELDLGQDGRSMCLSCVAIPCLCLLLKIELKIDLLRNKTGRMAEEEIKQEEEEIPEKDSGRLAEKEEPTIENHENEGRNSEREVGGGGVTSQKLPPILDCNHPPNHPCHLKIKM